MEWSKKEKEISRQAFSNAYESECMSIAHEIRKMVEEMDKPSDLWLIYDYLTEKRKQIDFKYDIVIRSFFPSLLDCCAKDGLKRKILQIYLKKN